MDKKRAVIIGAGPAGLTAAHELLRRASDSWDVVVLEGSNTIGGISKTVCHHGNRMDIGGHRFFSKDARVNDWWQERMPLQGAKSFDDLALGRDCPVASAGPDPETEDRVMLSRYRVSRIYYGRKFFDYPVSLNLKTLKDMGFLTTVKVGTSYVAAIIKKLPETNLENFYVNRFGRTLYSMFFEGYTEKLWGRHPLDISADWGAQRVKGLSVTAVLKNAARKLVGKTSSTDEETSLIDRFWYPKYGPGQMWEQVAQEIADMGGTIHMSATVQKLSVASDDSIVSVSCAGGQEYPCDVCLSTMPLKDLVPAIDGAPDGVRAITDGLPYRDFVTVGLLVPSLNLHNQTCIPTLANIVPDNWIYVQDSSVKLGRIQVFNNWSPYLVEDPLHTVWLGLEYFCAEADDFWNMMDDALVACAVSELVRMGVLSSSTKVLDSHVERVQKAYPAYFGTYDQIDDVRKWLDTHPNLWCLGRNGQHRYNNMDHSMLTAFYAVDALIAGSDDRARVWNVNTEADYHEEQS